MQSKAFDEVKKHLPKQPGIYKYFGEGGRLLYVGKAKNLKNRVSSYFNKNKFVSARILVMARQVQKIEFTIVETEQDALLLENSIIKKLNPKYNIQLRDDKTYPHICIKNEPFPRVFLTRKIIRDGSTYLGPYTSVKNVRALLELVKNLFPIRTCKHHLSETNINKGKFKVCLEYHIGNCKGGCVGLEAESDYLKSIQQIKNVLSGKYGQVKAYLKNEMEHFVQRYEFEKAESVKQRLAYLQVFQAKSTIVNMKLNDIDVFGLINKENFAIVGFLKVANGTIIQSKTIELAKNLDEPDQDVLAYAINHIRNKFHSTAKEIVIPVPLESEPEEYTVTVPQRGDKKKLIDLALKNALYHLQEIKMNKGKSLAGLEAAEDVMIQLKLAELPLHIECFDNSNIQGTNPVSSMVVFKDGKPSKKDYRHYKIKTVEGPDDFASMFEVVTRRYKRVIEQKGVMPNLVLIDGGKGQLSASYSALKELDLHKKCTLISIAKRNEEIFFPGDSESIIMDKKSEGLKLLQQLRDEAHRFAITFHRKLRIKATVKNELLEIKGIGKSTAEDLLRQYKSVKKIKLLSFEDLKLNVGPAKAKLIYDYFNIDSK